MDGECARDPSGPSSSMSHCLLLATLFTLLKLQQNHFHDFWLHHNSASLPTVSMSSLLVFTTMVHQNPCFRRIVHCIFTTRLFSSAQHCPSLRVSSKILRLLLNRIIVVKEGFWLLQWFFLFADSQHLTFPPAAIFRTEVSWWSRSWKRAEQTHLSVHPRWHKVHRRVYNLEDHFHTARIHPVSLCFILYKTCHLRWTSFFVQEKNEQSVRKRTVASDDFQILLCCGLGHEVTDPGTKLEPGILRLKCTDFRQRVTQTTVPPCS